MDCLQIRGGVPLEGAVAVSGSKNAALPVMAASILCDGPVVLDHVPDVGDVNTLALLLGHLGVEVKRGLDGAVRIETVDPRPTRAEHRLVRRMRASFCVLGPLVARRGRAVVSLPGGCNIGDRPVDLHLAGLQALGAEIRLRRGYVIAEARRLRGATIDLGGPHGPTVTGTANVMSAATLARGVTIIRGAACEPEIVDLGNFLNAAGAAISGLGGDTLEIRGVERLWGCRHRIIPDRIEAATLLIAAAITQGNVTLKDARADHLTAVLDVLAEGGAAIEVAPIEPSGATACSSSSAHCERALLGKQAVPECAPWPRIRVHTARRPRAMSFSARPYPGIPTDVQAQLTAWLTLADGTSTITDAVFPERFHHVAELNRLGAGIQRSGSTVTVHGRPRLSAAPVRASDLRASAALVLAALAANGNTTIRRLHHLNRGYERLEQKLATLGAQLALTSQGAVVATSALVSGDQIASAISLAPARHRTLRHHAAEAKTR